MIMLITVGRRTVAPRILGRSFSTERAQSFQNQRLSGRRRFYRNVQIARKKDQSSERSLNSLPSLVDSPISAGVDGSPSATGIKGSLPKVHLLSHVIEDENSYGVTLDGKFLKTPLGQPLMVPTHLLATAIAAEWNAQAPHINPTQMPLTTLVCTSLDQTSSQPLQYQQSALKFLPTDTICYYVDPMEDRQLYQKQQRAWDAVHRKVETTVGHAPAVAHGAEGILLARRGLPHPPALVDYARLYVESLDAWKLTILHTVASEAKSFWVAWYLLEHDPVSLSDIVELSRIEEEYQIENWGLVEGQHDYDRLNTSIQIRSAYLLKQLLE